jgi:hypothetical protein
MELSAAVLSGIAIEGLIVILGRLAPSSARKEVSRDK